MQNSKQSVDLLITYHFPLLFLSRSLSTALQLHFDEWQQKKGITTVARHARVQCITLHSEDESYRQYFIINHLFPFIFPSLSTALQLNFIALDEWRQKTIQLVHNMLEFGVFSAI